MGQGREILMLGRKYRCRAIGDIPIIRDNEERADLLGLLPLGFVKGNIAEVNGVIRRGPDTVILFTREADPHGGTRRVFEMPRWAFSAWFDEV